MPRLCRYPCFSKSKILFDKIYVKFMFGINVGTTARFPFIGNLPSRDDLIFIKMKIKSLIAPATLMLCLHAMVLLACSGIARAADGYETMGYFTYSTLDASGKPTYKEIMMFRVIVAAANWKIRMEPVIEGKDGIGFYEASHGSNDYVLSITALDSAYNSSESPFQSLRAELKNLKSDDVYFANSPVKIPAALSKFVSPRAPLGREPVTDQKTVTNRLNNVAVAVALKGEFPPTNPSHFAFLWFAFTPPTERVDGGNKMLLQIWDDGNAQNTRFRCAKWSQCHRADQNRPLVGTSKPANLRRAIHNSFLVWCKGCLTAS